MLNEFRIKSAQISIEDSVQWLANILPDIPSVVDSSKESV